MIGAQYVTWDIPDGELTADLATRHRVIREIRTFAPDLVLAHRPYDYHPDHRAAGQLVQDASYLVTVPNVLRDTPPLFRDPVVAYMPDLFTRPCPLAADVVLDVTEQADTVVRMLACHRTQVFEWLPYEEGILDQVPADEGEKLPWLREWFRRHVLPRAERFREDLVAALRRTSAAAGSSSARSTSSASTRRGPTWSVAQAVPRGRLPWAAAGVPGSGPPRRDAGCMGPAPPEGSCRRDRCSHGPLVPGGLAPFI